VEISPALGEISKGLVERGGSRFGLSTLSTGPAFPQLFFALFFGSTPAACSFAFALAFRLLILLGMLHPIARDV
jgi:hypothetical protein